MQWTLSRKPLIGISIGFFVIIIIGVNLHNNLKALKQTNLEVERTHQVAEHLDNLKFFLQQAESGQRGYLLTSDFNYLSYYQTAINGTNSEIYLLTHKIKYPIQVNRLNEIKTVVSNKIDELNNTIELKRHNKTNDALDIVKTNEGKELMENFYNLIYEAKKYDSILLLQAIAQEEADQQTGDEVVFSGGIFTIVMIILTLITLNSNYDNLIKSQESLNLSKTQFQNQLKETKSEYERILKGQIDFLSVTSHELRTPLTAILGWAELLKSGKLSANKNEEAIAIIEKNAKIQTKIIDDILNISRGIRGDLSIRIKAIQPTEIVRNALISLEPTAKAKNIEIITNFEDEVGIITADPERLSQVIWNLATNAIKFTPKRGHVWVSIIRQESSILIIVKDDGKGIKEDFKPYLFTYFRVADASTTRKYGGMGLGLAFSKQIVEMHGGKISAYSEGEGKGATFTIELPTRATTPFLKNRKYQEETVDIDVPFQINQVLSGIKILLVEDDLSINNMLVTTFNSYGAIVLSAISAIEALNIFSQVIPDILISDVGMEGEDGYSLIRKIRELPREKGGIVPAIALSAYAGENYAFRAKAEGFDEYIKKPVDHNVLISKIWSLSRN